MAPGTAGGEPALTWSLAARAPLEGLVLGAGLGLVAGGAIGALLGVLGLAGAGSAGADAGVADSLTGAGGFFVLGLLAGAAAGAATGACCGAVLVAGLGLASLLLRATGRRLSRVAGTVVVVVAVLLTPPLAVLVLAAVTDGAARGGVALTAAGGGPLLAGAVLAAWRYRRVTGVRSSQPHGEP